MISHHHKCVFVHIPKTAGQSIEQVFVKLLGLTWASRAPLLLQSNKDREIGPPRLAHLKTNEYVEYQHMTQSRFDGYYKFTFVRNPWDRMVSMYYYLGFPKYCDFDVFLGAFGSTEWENRYWFVCPQSEYVYNAGNLLVDFVGRYEHLQKDFNLVFSKLGLDQTVLSHTNKSKHRKSGYRNYYNSRTKSLVAELYKDDIERFDYHF